MDTEGLKVLQLLEEGKLTAAQAAELLQALGAPAGASRPPRPSGRLPRQAAAWAEHVGRHADACAERVPDTVERLVDRLDLGGLGWFGTGFPVDQTVEGELGGSGTVALQVATRGGRIVARGTDEEQRARVVLHRMVRAVSAAEARRRAAAIGKARIEDGRIVVGDGAACDCWGAYRLDVELLLPRRLRWSGSIESSNARVEVNGLGLADMEIVTSNGRIQLVDCRGERLTARTTNGRIEASRLGGEVRLRTSNGSIEVHLDPVEGDNLLELETSNGHIRVEGPARGVGWDVDAGTKSGRVRTDLPGVAADGDAAPPWGHAHMRRTTPDYAAQPRRVRCRAANLNGSITISAY